MQFDFTKFLLCRAVVQASEPDTDANRTALIASLIPGGRLQSMVFAKVLAPEPAASSQNAPSTAVAAQAAPPANAETQQPATKSRKVKVPHVSDRTEKADIERHFGEHKLRARIIERPTTGIRTPTAVHTWPEPDSDVEEHSEVKVFLLTQTAAARP